MMADDYIDLVLAKSSNDEIFIGKAPKFSGLRENDQIIMETGNCNIECGVETVITLRLMGEEMDFITRALGNKPLKNKVKGKILYDSFHYPEDEGDE